MLRLLRTLLAQDPNAAAGNRSHCELRMARHAQLPYDENVQRRPECRRYLGRDRDPATGEPQHEQIAPSVEAAQSVGELTSGIVPVGEWEGHGQMMARRP